MSNIRNDNAIQQTHYRCGWFSPIFRCLLSLFALLLIAGIIAYCVEYYHCSRFTPTGDALFDRYARAVIKRQAPRLWFQRQCDFLIPQAHIPDSELAEWDGEFGSDPRYWQLRCCNAQEEDYAAYKLSQSPAWRNSEMDYGHADDFLIEGYQQGARDWVLVTHVARAAHLLMYDVLEARKDEFGEPGTVEFTEKFGAAQSELEAEVQALFAEAIALAPEQAWPYYERALYWMDLGEHELAKADFAAGNTAPMVAYPCLFPESFVRDRLNETNYRVNGSINGALLTAGSLNTDLMWWIRIKERAMELIVATELGGTTSLNTEFHRFLCRAAQAEYSDPAYEIAAFSSLELLYGHYLTAHPELNTNERTALFNAVKDINNAQVQFNAEGSKAAYSGCCIFTFLPEVANDPMLNNPDLQYAIAINPRYGVYQRFNWCCYFRRLIYEDAAWGEMVSQQLRAEYLDSLARRLEHLDLADISAYCDEFGQHL